VFGGVGENSVYPYYSGLFLPAKTPRDIVERLHRETAEALQAPEVQARFKKLGVGPMPMSLDEFAAFFKKDVGEAVALVEAAKIPRQ
jgi:tripartite-type tricarboxylate transporter receptor subunit TctC